MITKVIIALTFITIISKGQCSSNPPPYNPYHGANPNNPQMNPTNPNVNPNSQYYQQERSKQEYQGSFDNVNRPYQPYPEQSNPNAYANPNQPFPQNPNYGIAPYGEYSKCSR
jgi:hypothetical protein